jgi:hypothetical protein
MTDRYAGERFVPKVPSCGKSTLSLCFDGRSLRLQGARIRTQFSAVSGRPKGGSFDYSVEYQKIPSEGPTPEGQYWIQPSELQENKWYRLYNTRDAWGDYWITIHPYPDTQTYGRGGFFIHGGKTPGSAGCIDLTKDMNLFVEALARELAGQTECYVPLTVRYVR